MTNYNSGEWFGWNGGERPVHPKTTVEAIYKNPVKSSDVIKDTRLASIWCWSATTSEIVAFRVIKEYKEPREFWIDKQDKQVLTVNPNQPEFYIHVKEVLTDD